MRPGSSVLPPEVLVAITEGVLSCAAIKLAVILGRFMNENGQCWPAKRTLQRAAGIKSTDTLKAACESLKTAGLISWSKGTGRKRTVWKWTVAVPVAGTSTDGVAVPVAGTSTEIVKNVAAPVAGIVAVPAVGSVVVPVAGTRSPQLSPQGRPQGEGGSSLAGERARVRGNGPPPPSLSSDILEEFKRRSKWTGDDEPIRKHLGGILSVFSVEELAAAVALVEIGEKPWQTTDRMRDGKIKKKKRKLAR